MCSDPILVWDNEADHLELLAYNLSRSGYSVVPVPSEEAVPSLAQVHNPCMVILGNCSSEERRAEICKQLKQELPQILLLCLTTDDHCWERPYNQDAGMNACIIFPTKPKQILKVVKSLLKESGSPCCGEEQGLSSKEEEFIQKS